MKGNFEEEKKQSELFLEERAFLEGLLGEEIFGYYQIKGEKSSGQCENCFFMDGKGLPFSEGNPQGYAAAGVYQMLQGTSNLEWAGSFFDDPRDQEMVNLGIKWYEQGHKNFW